jgi:hypothetical protein
LAPLATVGDVGVSFGINGRIGHGMEIVGDFHGDLHGYRSAFAARRSHSKAAAGGPFGHARHNLAGRGDEHRSFDITEKHTRLRAIDVVKAAALNDDFAARDGGAWQNAINAWSGFASQLSET